MRLKIGEAARMAGTTVRALHYYDQIGLLSPDEVTESGYRYYGEPAMETLQQIMFFRELDFSLDQIKKIMTSPVYDKSEALARQKELLCRKKERLERLIDLIGHVMEGEKKMSFEEFDRTQIEEIWKKYAGEAEERFAKTEAYAESTRRTAGYGDEEWRKIQSETEEIFKALAERMDKGPEDEEVQQLVRKWQEHISTWFYPCTDEILSGLGAMYAGDPRFQENMDQYGEGLAVFLAAACI